MRENLSSIDTYIATINPYIEKFNEYSKINYDALSARVERCNNMMSNQFKGYLASVEK